jgi:uncharacterized membrane protein YcaP (DUF421 family)
MEFIIAVKKANNCMRIYEGRRSRGGVRSMQEFWVIVLRASGAITMLYLLTRILGKKQISQLTFFEYITGIAIGDLAGFMSTDMEADYWHGITALFVWFTIPLLAEYFALKSKTMRNWLEGKGTIFIQDGKVLEDNLRKERYTSDELMEQMRTKGVFNPSEVEFAMLEPTGDLSVMLKNEYQPLTPNSLGMKAPLRKPPQAVIMDGNIMHEGLEFLGFDEAWLKRELEKLHLTIQEIFLGVVDWDGQMYVDLYRDRIKKPVRRSRRVRSVVGKRP